VNGDGSVATGTGFTVTVLSTGRYRINFSAAFSSTPAVLVTNVFGSINVDAGTSVQPALNAVVDQASPSFALVATGDAGGTLTSESFQFLAITKP
jgi:hypothetical protein